MPFPENSTLIDDFNRADGPLGANWPNRVLSGNATPEIFDYGGGVQAAWNGGGQFENGSSAYVTSYDPDQTFQVDLHLHGLNTMNVAIFCCLSSPGTSGIDGYALYVQKLSGADDWSLWRIDDGSFTEIGSVVTADLVDGIGIEYKQSTGTLKSFSLAGSTWTERDSATGEDTYDQGGRPGLLMQGYDWALDDFRGGSIAAAGGGKVGAFRHAAHRLHHLLRR